MGIRTIIFRGKTTSKELPIREFNNIWVEGDLIKNRDKYYIHPHGNVFRVEHELTKLMAAHEVIPETIGQFTGLTDKNGTKIFEGDYWIDTDDDYLLYVVEFRNGQFCFVSYGVRGALMEYGWSETAGGWGECDCEPMTDYNIETIEIFGNIHDNPELLGE